MTDDAMNTRLENLQYVLERKWMDIGGVAPSDFNTKISVTHEGGEGGSTIVWFRYTSLDDQDGAEMYWVLDAPVSDEQYDDMVDGVWRNTPWWFLPELAAKPWFQQACQKHLDKRAG